MSNATATNVTKTNKPGKPAPAVKSAPAAPAKPTRGGELRNGVRRPTGHGVVAAIWAALDSLPATEVETAAQVREVAEQCGFNTNLALSHWRQWKRWNAA